ncbi:MAG: 4-alpha-glucanotransferase [Dysgonamonadaceae bacterium]|jgi:4-alpha-glucanotransferase|nr:4-alpha-glucanotransferase [Dysgonamonadaceae bacterium]
MKICFQLNYHTVWGQTIHVAGSIPALGHWNPAAAPQMQSVGDGYWLYELCLPDTGLVFPVEYKFCLQSPQMPWHSQSSLRWETGYNHVINPNEVIGDITHTFSQIEFQEETPCWKCAGLAIPVFSLRSRNSFGIGDFGDLLLMIDWIKLTHQKIIQILPVNDTTQTRSWQDSYPYNAISIYALHPLYINLNEMGELKDPKRRTFYQRQQKKLNALSVVDYEAVDRLKWQFFKEMFQQESERELFSHQYINFFEENREWLLPYAAYCCRRDNSSTPELYYYIQFHANRQMIQVRNYARQQGIILKGDIPIGVNRDSVEAQTEPGYFNLDFQTGAPPDAFSSNGQNWGFPTYNWQAMEADNYQWWKKRFRKMADYFDAYRIDHILGFFRIWQIPAGQANGLSGYFYPALPLSIADIEHAGLAFDRVNDLFIEDGRQALHYHPRIVVGMTAAYQQLSDTEKQSFNRLHDDYFYCRNNEFWKYQALKRLAPLVNATGMLACGEDLGMIPSTVPEIMRQLQILSLEIERMPKSMDSEFTDLQHIPYFSVCTTSTHDMTTLRGWWKEDREKRQRYYNEVLNRDGLAPEDCSPEICRQIIYNHLSSPSMLTIIPLQDWLSMDESLRASDPDAERINIPALSRHYWRYRMHLAIEELLTAAELNESIRNMIRDTSRNI